MPVFKIVNIYKTGTEACVDYEVDLAANEDRMGGHLRLTLTYRDNQIVSSYGTVVIDTNEYGESISFPISCEDSVRLLKADGYLGSYDKEFNANV